jgi:hypothetical protein
MNRRDCAAVLWHDKQNSVDGCILELVAVRLAYILAAQLHCTAKSPQAWDVVLGIITSHQ